MNVLYDCEEPTDHSAMSANAKLKAVDSVERELISGYILPAVQCAGTAGGLKAGGSRAAVSGHDGQALYRPRHECRYCRCNEKCKMPIFRNYELDARERWVRG